MYKVYGLLAFVSLVVAIILALVYAGMVPVDLSKIKDSWNVLIMGNVMLFFFLFMYFGRRYNVENKIRKMRNQIHTR
jgi:ABC-type uncharacterized transport system permease subunit